MASHWSNEAVCQFHHRPQGTVGASEIVCACVYVCVSEWEPVRACVVICLCVCMCVRVHRHINLVQMCVCVSVCDVVTSRYCLRERGGEEERKGRKDVLGEGWEVHQAEWKVSMPQNNCCGIYTIHTLSVFPLLWYSVSFLQKIASNSKSSFLQQLSQNIWKKVAKNLISNATHRGFNESGSCYSLFCIIPTVIYDHFYHWLYDNLYKRSFYFCRLIVSLYLQLLLDPTKASSILFVFFFFFF